MIEAFEFNRLVGNRIMNRRLYLHYTREYFVEIADISLKFLYEIEMGKRLLILYYVPISTLFRCNNRLYFLRYNQFFL